MSKDFLSGEYKVWLAEIKARIAKAQVKVARAANSELIRYYWDLGKAVTNFKKTLPSPQSDLAQQTLKDPYTFDFLTMTKPYNERDIENKLIENISDFLLELGKALHLGDE